MPVEIFFCYAREDEALRQELEKQLRVLRSEGLIEIWHDRKISAGSEWQREINRYLNSADIILLLVSPDPRDAQRVNSKHPVKTATAGGKKRGSGRGKEGNIDQKRERKPAGANY